MSILRWPLFMGGRKPRAWRGSTISRSARPIGNALDWIRKQEVPGGGIRVHSRHPNAYPEVTGYAIPTLLTYGERELARRHVEWLIAIQRASGGFPEPDGGLVCLFDSGQVLRGLLAGIDLHPHARDAAHRTADYILSQLVTGGTGGFFPQYNGQIPESVLLYVLPPLVQAAEVLGHRPYRAAVDDCVDCYLGHPDARNVNALTHFLGYELEALIDLNRASEAAGVLEKLEALQLEDGSVRGAGTSEWVCSPGLAQLAICWYKLGHSEPADRALDWLESRQETSGGFFGSYGPGATYFPADELSWAVKFYLDAHLLRMMSFFEKHASVLPASVSTADGRLQAILAHVIPGQRVLEVGCGKGRFLKALHSSRPGVECTGVDISPSMLRDVPPDIRTLRGSLESIPCADDSYDVVFSVEAIEHSPNPTAAVAELIRVVKPGGWVIVIDKERSHWGRLTTPAWEWWPDQAYLNALLTSGCDHVASEPVAYDDHPSADGLMVAWHGQKRSRLSGTDWHGVLISDDSLSEMLTRLRANQLTEWGQVMALATSPGQRVLEIGSGTGEISLHLARGGRLVTAMDLDVSTLAFTCRAARDLDVEFTTVAADATQPLPFSDNTFDCVWSSGLLEHFVLSQRIQMLREWARVTSGTVINLVPNAASVAYRIGKYMQETQGDWRYGLEMPILSLRPDYEAAGLRVEEEFSIAPKQALAFLPPEHPLKEHLLAWIDRMPLRDLRDCNQGYLLVTIGTKRKGIL
jgi:ubiquinone/menaquinone biosynthesis C-methylase UbiE